jgi:hypothetical protein
MSAISTVSLARSLGVRLFIQDGRIAAKPSSAVTGLLRQEVRAHKDELLITLGAAHETAYTDTATRSERQRACVGEGGGRDTGARAQQGSRGRSLARGIEAPQVGAAAPSTGPATDEQQAVSDAKRQALEERLAITERLAAATAGLPITAEQFRSFLSQDDLADIAAGFILVECLRAYAEIFSKRLPTPLAGALVCCADCAHFERIDYPHLGRCAQGHGWHWLWDTDQRQCEDFEAAVEARP